MPRGASGVTLGSRVAESSYAGRRVAESNMPPLMRWWLNRQWAHDTRHDALMRIDVGIIAFGTLLVLLLR